jgi:hypothetical protein
VLYASVGTIFGILFYWTYTQYMLWLGHPLSQFLLPPYQSAGYFVEYVYSRWFAPWLASLFFGFLIAWLAAYLDRRWGGMLFEEEEPRLIGLGIFLTGYPGFLLYLIIFSLCYLSYNATVTFKKRTEDTRPTCLNGNSGGRGGGGTGVRVSMYYFWLPTAIFAIIVKSYLIPAEVWRYFSL